MTIGSARAEQSAGQCNSRASQADPIEDWPTPLTGADSRRTRTALQSQTSVPLNNVTDRDDPAGETDPRHPPTADPADQPPRSRPRPPQRPASPPSPVNSDSADAGSVTSGAGQDQPRPQLIRLDDVERGLRPLPTRGWRRLIYRGTGGRLNPGRSAREHHRLELERQARTRLRGNYRIGVVGKGGVGKTTVAACLGSTLAHLRHEDRVVAIDADAAFGKLGDRIDPGAVDSYTQLVTDPHLRSFSDVRSHLGCNRSGLFVLPGDPLQQRPLTPALYSLAVAQLARYFAITIVDCGATMDSPLTRTVARNLHAAIVVATPWADATSIAHESLDWLAAHGAPGLLNRTIVVLNNSDGNAKDKMLEEIAETFLRRNIPTFGLPFDRRLRPGGLIDLDQGATSPTREQFLEIAAELGANFTTAPVQPATPRGSAG